MNNKQPTYVRQRSYSVASSWCPKQGNHSSKAAFISVRPRTGCQATRVHCNAVETQGPSCTPSKAHEPSPQTCTTPLVDAVIARGSRTQEVPLHVPGHKRGRVLDPSMRRLLAAGSPTAHKAACTAPPDPETDSSASAAANPLQYDLTELSGLDYLSSPSSVIKAAQDLAATTFKAQHTWFLVNGCSVGIHAAVMATVKPGEALLLARNCHLSAFSACVLTDAVPVWLQPEEDTWHGIAHCITPEQLSHGFQIAKQRGLKVGAVLVVTPTYYGAVARVPELAELCHAQGVPLLVDEAHGGHLQPLALDLATPQAGTSAAQVGPAGRTAAPSDIADHTQLATVAETAVQATATPVTRPPSWTRVPPSALSAGADLVMHSTHKVLTAMTQAAMLHLGPWSHVNPNRVSKALQVLQTSSPSYLLLCSLDAARRHAFTPGAWLMPLAAAADARQQLAALPGLSVLQDGSCGAQESVAGFDPLRLVVNVHAFGLSGYDAAAWLEDHHGIVPELSTQRLVVFVFGPGSTYADATALAEACRQLSTTKNLNSSQHAHDTIGVERTAASTAEHACTCSSQVPVEQQQQLPEHQHGQQQGSWPATAPALTPRETFYADSEAMPLHAAVGRVSAELLCPYPPGVPVVFPGEVLSDEAVQLLRATLASGGVVTGGQDPLLQTVLVVVPDAC